MKKISITIIAIFVMGMFDIVQAKEIGGVAEKPKVVVEKGIKLEAGTTMQTSEGYNGLITVPRSEAPGPDTYRFIDTRENGVRIEIKIYPSLTISEQFLHGQIDAIDKRIADMEKAFQLFAEKIKDEIRLTTAHNSKEILEKIKSVRSHLDKIKEDQLKKREKLVADLAATRAQRAKINEDAKSVVEEIQKMMNSSKKEEALYRKADDDGANDIKIQPAPSDSFRPNTGATIRFLPAKKKAPGKHSGGAP